MNSGWGEFKYFGIRNKRCEKKKIFPITILSRQKNRVPKGSKKKPSHQTTPTLASQGQHNTYSQYCV